MDDQAISRFWDNFIEKLEAYQVKPDVVRWYVRYAEQYIKTHPKRRLTTHTPQNLGQDLKIKGRNSDFKGWQYQWLVATPKRKQHRNKKHQGRVFLTKTHHLSSSNCFTTL